MDGHEEKIAFDMEEKEEGEGREGILRNAVRRRFERSGRRAARAMSNRAGAFRRGAALVNERLPSPGRAVVASFLLGCCAGAIGWGLARRRTESRFPAQASASNPESTTVSQAA